MEDNPVEKDFLNMTVRQFIQVTADKTPTPGGGSIAAVVGALATALGEMALAFTRGKKKFTAHEELYVQVADRAQRARGLFLELVKDDVAAFELYQQTSRMEAGGEKDRAMQTALAAAINVPRQTSKLALAVMKDMASLADKCNPYLASDLLAGAALIEATVRLCDYNVLANTPQMPDSDQAGELRQASVSDVQQARNLRETIERTAFPGAWPA